MKNVINNIGEQKELVGFELEVFNILKKKLPNFKQYLFVIYGNNGNDLPLSRYIQHDKKILIWRSNENKLNRVDELKKDYKHIFTNYYFDNKNSTSLQLGYHTETKNKEIIPITERLFNLSFTGCLNRNRVQLASILSNIPIKWIAMGMVFNKKLILKIINGLIKWKFNKDYFQFNDGFNNGLNEEDYNFILRNTKIALCPKGWVNQETFRLYESMKWGCVVISEDLPNRSYYKGIPIIKVKDWSEGIEVANRLIEDTNELERLSKKNIQFYKDNLSAESTANLIIKRITKKGSGK
jgi:glycosyltransferase involved in cell wall biosynthesis